MRFCVLVLYFLNLIVNNLHKNCAKNSIMFLLDLIFTQPNLKLLFIINRLHLN